MKAWLVTWVWAADAAALADEIAAILPPRWSRDRVADVVEFLYALTTSSPTELAAYARNRSNNPYQAELQNFGRISCGANPFLYARPVSDLTIDKSDDRLETICWREPPVFEIGPDSFARTVRDGTTKKMQRRLTGPLSTLPIWDRALGRFKQGWGPGEQPSRPE